jgi:hypothetical protein
MIVEGTFDYSAQMTYADVVYSVITGFINSTLGFTTNNQKQCLNIFVNYYRNTSQIIPRQILA